MGYNDATNISKKIADNIKYLVFYMKTISCIPKKNHNEQRHRYISKYDGLHKKAFHKRKEKW